MKGVVYTTKLPAVPGSPERGGTMLLEIWLEDIGLCINEKEGAFRSQGPRMAFKHFGTVNVSDDFCAAVQNYVEAKEFFESNNHKIFTTLNQRYKK